MALTIPRTGSPTHPEVAPDDREAVARALGVLEVLPRREHVLGYSRDHFGGWGQRWWSPPGNGAVGAVCSTRDIAMFDVFHLRESGGATDVTECPSPGGTAIDVYTGDEITPGEVEVDHVVALSTAWDHGAWAWDRAKRVEFANDVELNLLAVAGPVNQAKSDGTLGEWSPPTAKTGSPSGAGCAYAARYLAVSDRYDLSVSVRDVEVAALVCGL